MEALKEILEGGGLKNFLESFHGISIGAHCRQRHSSKFRRREEKMRAPVTGKNPLEKQDLGLFVGTSFLLPAPSLVLL
jgi:hypothetical protein